MTVYTTLLSRGREERVSHFGTWIDLSSLPLAKKKKKVNRKVKSRTVSRVNRRGVVSSVCLAIKTPTPRVRSQWFFKNNGVRVLLWFFFFKMSPRPISGKNIQSTTINTTNTKYKDGLSSRRCSIHWRIILKIKTVKWRGPLAGNEKEKNASELPKRKKKNLFFF